MNEPPRWRVQTTRQVERRLRKLPRDILKRIEAALDGLAHNPRPSGCVKMAGFENLYRVRVGDWRIVYTIDDDRLLILIIEVEARGGAYRNL